MEAKRGLPYNVVPPRIAKALQELINTRHLYQSVRLDWEEIKEQIQRVFNYETQAYNMIVNQSWGIDAETGPAPHVRITLPPLITYCALCKKRVPHNLTGNTDRPVSLWPGPEQTLIIPLECQGCRKARVVFQVTRHGDKLQLTGRSVFEEVQVPDYIPAPQRKYYSGAIIAFQSGQVLPALFMLRTLIEQCMRAEADCVDLRGDVLCDKYADALPDSFKQQFPSSKEIYRNLSDALHSANDDKALFEKEKRRIELHLHSRLLLKEAARLKRPASRTE